MTPREKRALHSDSHLVGSIKEDDIRLGCRGTGVSRGRHNLEYKRGGAEQTHKVWRAKLGILENDTHPSWPWGIPTHLCPDESVDVVLRGHGVVRDRESNFPTSVQLDAVASFEGSRRLSPVFQIMRTSTYSPWARGSGWGEREGARRWTWAYQLRQPVERGAMDREKKQV